MKWNNRDLFQQLGIKTPETSTEQDIEEAYFEKMLELYIKIRLVKERVLEEEKLDKEDMIKEELYRKMREMPSTRVKIMALDQDINELGETRQEKVNFQMQIQKYAEAYETLRNEEKRKEYIRNTIAKKAVEYQLVKLIEKNGGDITKKLKTYEVVPGNKPTNVMKKEKDIIPYDIRHEDEEITLSQKDVILFQNNIIAEELPEYLLVMKGEDNVDICCTVQGEIIFPELIKQEYRAALFQAILQSRREGKSYFGSIVKKENEYIIKKDRAHELAIEKMEEIETLKRREGKGDEAR